MPHGDGTHSRRRGRRHHPVGGRGRAARRRARGHGARHRRRVRGGGRRHPTRGRGARLDASGAGRPRRWPGRSRAPAAIAAVLVPDRPRRPRRPAARLRRSAADDYVPKPFAIAEVLAARVRSRCCAGSGVLPPTDARSATSSSTRRRGRASRGDAARLPSTATECRLLAYLATNRGRDAVGARRSSPRCGDARTTRTTWCPPRSAPCDARWRRTARASSTRFEDWGTCCGWPPREGRPDAYRGYAPAHPLAPAPGDAGGPAADVGHAGPPCRHDRPRAPQPPGGAAGATAGGPRRARRLARRSAGAGGSRKTVGGQRDLGPPGREQRRDLRRGAAAGEAGPGNRRRQARATPTGRDVAAAGQPGRRRPPGEPGRRRRCVPPAVGRRERGDAYGRAGPRGPPRGCRRRPGRRRAGPGSGGRRRATAVGADHRAGRVDRARRPGHPPAPRPPQGPSWGRRRTRSTRCSTRWRGPSGWPGTPNSGCATSCPTPLTSSGRRSPGCARPVSTCCERTRRARSGRRPSAPWSASRSARPVLWTTCWSWHGSTAVSLWRPRTST